MNWRVLQGDCREVLRELPDESVQCCVTSPPYFGLRDYGHGGQLGLEPTPQEFVAAMVDVFREVRRVLRDDGTLWLNLGDTFNSNPSWGRGVSTLEGRPQSEIPRLNHTKVARSGLKPKDLIGIPWRVAFALQDDGWYLRSDIIWHKPNPMPESVTDRPTKAHEYLFLLSKSPRYFYDADAIKEDGKDWSTGGPSEGIADTSERYGAGNGGNGGLNQLARKYRSVRPGVDTNGGAQGEGYMDWDPARRNKRSVWTVPTRPYAEAHFATFPPDLIEPCIVAGSRPDTTVLDPFAGAGTTGVVALRHDRSFVGIELNPEYVEMARRRIVDDAPLLNQWCEA